MDTRTLRRLIKRHLVPVFPELTLNSKESDLFFDPMNHIYRYFSFAGSAYSTATIRVNAAFMPLYVPADFYHVTLGKRLQNGHTDVWEWSEAEETKVFESIRDAMRTQGMERLGKVQSPLDLARMAPLLNSPDSEAVKQAVDYSLIYTGQFEEAQVGMEEYMKPIEIRDRRNPPTEPWDLERQRLERELSGLLKQNPEEARQLLLQWEQQTIKNLKLEKYPN